jgi:hypothetical protein
MHRVWHVQRIRVLRLPAIVCAVTVTVGVALAGCGGSSGDSKSGSTTTSSSTTGAASGTVSGHDGGFTTVIPRGFVNGLAALSGGPLTLQYAALAPRVDGFRPNINVVRESAHGLSDAGSIANREITGVKTVAPQAHGFSAVRTLTLDGAPARGVDYLNRPTGGPPLHQYQVFALHANMVYTVTYTALSSRYQTTLAGMQQVLAAWRWK